MRVEVICKVCGKHEFVPESRAKKYVTCSKKCLGELQSERYSKRAELVCPICGEVYECKQSALKHHRTCGKKECRSKWYSQSRIGEKNPNYKTYEDVLREESAHGEKHDKSKTSYRHIVKFFFNLKSEKDIPSGYVVHHKDANHMNNTPENLVMLPKSAHTLIHRLFGNILISALHGGVIDRETFYKMCNDAEKAFYEKVENLNITCQKIISQTDAKNILAKDDNIYKYIIKNEVKNRENK